MKLVFKFPFPDHHPRAAFEFLTGYGRVYNLDPNLATFEYDLEDESLGDLMRRLQEVAHEICCYDWWEHSRDTLDFFEQAQKQLDAQKLGRVEISLAQRDALGALLSRVMNNTSLRPTDADRTLAFDIQTALAAFEEFLIEEPAV